MATLTEKQDAFIKNLLEARDVPLEYREKLEEIYGSLDTRAASTVIEHLLAMPKKAKDNAAWAIPDSIPDSRYAILKDDEIWKFYRIVTSRSTKRRHVQKVFGAPGDFRYDLLRDKAERDWALAEIAKDPAFASQCFGMQVGACGICGSPLTDPESIALGIGPICAKKYDW